MSDLKRYAILDESGNVANIVAALSEDDCTLPEGCTIQELTKTTQTMGNGDIETIYQSAVIGQPLI